MGRLRFIAQAEEGWHRLFPDADLRPLSLMQLLVWSGRLAEDVLERTALSAGLRKRGDYEVLALIRRSDPVLLTPAEIAGTLMTSPSGMTGKLDRLENQGLIVRIADANDRRVVRLGMTDEGKRLADESFKIALTVYADMMASMSEQQVDQLTSHLETLIARLDEMVGTSGSWQAAPRKVTSR